MSNDINQMGIDRKFIEDTNIFELSATAEYLQLVDNISLLWDKAKEKAVQAINGELLDANWQTGQYIVEFEQKGKTRAQYGKQLLVNLSKDLTRTRGKGFSRSNLTYMRKLYLTFPKSETLSHKLTWSHVLIDLKREEIKHNDIGQMNLYLNYFKTEICQSDDNPPIGIVLGAKKDELLMEYALQGITNQLFAARYQLYLPKREELQAQLDAVLSETQEK